MKQTREEDLEYSFTPQLIKLLVLLKITTYLLTGRCVNEYRSMERRSGVFRCLGIVDEDDGQKESW